jgi:hypothetical protein
VRAFVIPCNFGDAKVTVISAQDRNENFVITVAFSGYIPLSPPHYLWAPFFFHKK